MRTFTETYCCKFTENLIIFYSYNRSDLLFASNMIFGLRDLVNYINHYFKNGLNKLNLIKTLN